ncbi:MAG: InlB B-repeat-containing protein [Desulfosalsimonadaceae bacterium]
MKPHSLAVLCGMIFCFLSLLFTGCGSGSSSDSLPVVTLENGVMIPTASDVRRLETADGMAYFVTADALLHIVNISDINVPREMDAIPVDPEADIALGGGMLYVLEKNILRIFDATDPDSIRHRQDIELQKIIDSPDPVSYFSSLAYHNGRVFAVLMSWTSHGAPYTYFYAMDAARPEEVHAYLMEENADQIVGADGDVVYANHYANISLMDTGDLNHIQSETIGLSAVDSLRLAVADQTACFINQTGANDYPLALAIADISGAPADPVDPSGTLPFTGKADRGVSVYPKALVIQNQAAFVALISGELVIFDIHDPDHPEQIKTIDYGVVDAIGVPEIRFRDMEILDDTAFIGCSKGLVILDLAGGTARVGRFMDSPAAGLTYNTPSLHGLTGDGGEFSYQSGETVEFSVGGVSLGQALGKAIVTPVDLVPGAADETDPVVTNIARLLLSLDADCDPANGISISQAIREEMQGRSIDVTTGPEIFESQADAVLSALNSRNLFACGDVALWPMDEARRHLRATIKGTPQYKLTVKAGQHCSVTIDPRQDFYDEGQTVTLTLVPETGWKFKNWLGDAGTYENPAIVTMNRDRTVIAVPEEAAPSSFPVPVVLRITESGSGTVTANPPGGTYHADPHGYLTKNLVVALTAIPAPGWTFDHWEQDVTGTMSPETIVIDGYKNVTAVFAPLPSNRHTLQADHTGMGGVRLDPPGGVYYAGTPVTLTAILEADWTFTGWGGGLSGTDSPQILTMSTDYQVTAEFTETPGERFTLTALTDRGTVVNFWPPAALTYEGSMVSAEYKPGTAVTVTAVTRPGYVFIGWGGDLSGSDNPQILTMDGDKTISLVSEAQ